MRALSALVACLALGASAKGDIFWILGAGNQTSATGVPFATDLRVVNYSSTPANVQLTFVPVGTSATATSPGVYSVLPGTPLTITDVLNQVWGLTETSGAIQLTSDQPLLISATRHGAGVGTDLPVIANADLFQSGDVGDALWVSESGDSGSGFSTRFQVYLADANVSATLLLYDPTGNVMAANPLSGGPGLFEVTASSLLSAALPIGRAELRVSNGTAAGWVELHDNTTGDPMAMSFSNSSFNAGTLLVTSAAHGSTPAGTLLQTDVRLFNPTGRSQNVSFFDFNGHATRVTLPPHSMQEVLDVVGSVLNLSPAGPITIQLMADTTTIVAASRTAVVPQPGSPGIYGEIHPVLPSDPESPPQVITYLYAVPKGALAGMLTARTDSNGGTYQVNMLGPMGDTQASSGPVTVPNSSTLQSELADLLGAGTTVPDGAHLEIVVTSGNVETEYVNFAATTGDPIYREAVRLPDMVAICPTPSIDLLTSSMTALTAPGNITINWQTSLSETVDLDPAATGLTPIGSMDLPIVQSTDFQLVAHNPCGDETSPFSVTLGPPSPSSLGLVAADGSVDTSGTTSAAPGQQIQIQVDNLASGTAVDAVLFQAPDGTSYTVIPDSVGDTGAVNVRVPWWIDSTAVGGYRTGSMTVAVSSGGMVGGAVPITIEPLTFDGDSIAAFSAILDFISATSAAFTSSLDPTLDPGLADVATMQQAFSATYESSLRNMLASIAANGSASLAWGAEPPGPNAISVTVTLQDITNLMAYNANLLGPIPPAGSRQTDGVVAMLRGKMPATPHASFHRDLNPLNCLSSPTRYPYTLITACKALKAGQALGQQMQDYLGLLPTDQIVNYAENQVANGIQKILSSGTAGAVMNKMKGWLRGLEVLCLVEPITLKNFFVTPTRFQNRGPYRNTSQATALYAQMVSAISDPSIMKSIEQYETNQYMKKLGQSVKLNQVESAAVKAFVGELLQDANSGFDAALTQVARSVTGATNTSQPMVGQCDLDHFYPMKNHPDNIFVRGVGLLESGFESPQGDLLFYYIGRKQGRETFCIDPIVSHFLFPDDLEFSFTALQPSNTCRYMSNVRVPGGATSIGARKKATPFLVTPPVVDPDEVFSQDVTVGDATGTLGIAAASVFAEYANFITGDEGDSMDGYSSPVGAGQVDPVPQNWSVSSGNATSSIAVTQTGANSWSATVSLNYELTPDPNNPMNVGEYSDGIINLWLKYQNPENRDDTEAVHVDVSSDGACSGGFISGANAQDINGNITTTTGCPAPKSCPLTGTPPGFSFDAIGAIAGTVSLQATRGQHGDPGQSGACTVTISISLTQ